MFRVIQVLNNNAAVVKNASGIQMVVMGLGIAFRKKKGDLIRKEDIETIFSLRNAEATESFLMLLKDIPLDFVSVTYAVINDWINLYHYPLQDYIYVTLTDHIYCSYQALMDNRYQESKLPNVAEHYPLEYQMAAEGLRMFRTQLLVEFPDDELNRIALHLINAKGDNTIVDKKELNNTKEMMQQIEVLLAKQGIYRSDSNSHFYDRLMIHLTYLLSDINRVQDTKQTFKEVEEQFKKQHPRAYQLGEDVYQIIGQQTGVPLHPSERFYLFLHIQRLL